MRYKAKVEVSLKKGYYDPEGETIKNSLLDLKYSVDEVRASKLFHITLEADSLESARSEVEEMSQRLLSNPVKDNYRIEIEEIE
ncbi:MAG: phosphoribosylformylglycinamidine synthase subunit PurS [Candidatus Bathyarchaeota archaeon]|nr:MAG: phosphoribosylformylglycinamidine synthase subunit PurS [Candidatus Bathyarchaeota archaeon]